MENIDLTQCLDRGNLYIPGENKENNAGEWTAHAKFKGVYLKNLITGTNTGGAFSTHLVRVDSNCEIGEHIHEGKTELHEVVDGNGICTIGEKEYNYNPGDSALILHDVRHKVVAGESGLFLLAKFVPALV